MGPIEPQAFVIEIEERQAGLALKVEHGFRFVAADPAFALLDGSRFAGLPQLRQAANRLARLLRAA